MAYTLMNIKRTFQIILLLLGLWIIGVLFQFPLIPFVETEYALKGTNQKFENGILVWKDDDMTIKVEIPKYFSEQKQCIDTRFNATNGQHNLTVSNYSAKAFRSDSSEIPKQNSYVFWDNGSKDETFSILNYQIVKSETQDKTQYVFFRSVFDFESENYIIIQIKFNFSLDNIEDSFEKSIAITKNHKLTWNKLRAH